MIEMEMKKYLQCLVEKHKKKVESRINIDVLKSSMVKEASKGKYDMAITRLYDGSRILGDSERDAVVGYLRNTFLDLTISSYKIGVFDYGIRISWADHTQPGFMSKSDMEEILRQKVTIRKIG